MSDECCKRCDGRGEIFRAGTRVWDMCYGCSGTGRRMSRAEAISIVRRDARRQLWLAMSVLEERLSVFEAMERGSDVRAAQRARREIATIKRILAASVEEWNKGK